jgi:hypothetical protein
LKQLADARKVAPPKTVRLMVGLLLHKQVEILSDEAVVAR